MTEDLVDPSIEILNHMASNISNAEALRNEIAQILKSLQTSSPPEPAQNLPLTGNLSFTAPPGDPTPRPELSTTREPLWVPSSLMARYDREDLYERVWTVPIRKLAKQYGVSDVALAKSCRKLSIPLPGRGYWAKKVANQPVGPRPPLPAIAIRTPKLAGREPSA
jgi:hypothetical protein